MTMTHKEALAIAAAKSIGTPGSTCVEDDIEVAIRAYIEARGMVLVPMEATGEMHGAALYTRRKNIRDIYGAMLSAAPDPFKEDNT